MIYAKRIVPGLNRFYSGHFQNTPNVNIFRLCSSSPMKSLEKPWSGSIEESAETTRAANLKFWGKPREASQFCDKKHEKGYTNPHWVGGKWRTGLVLDTKQKRATSIVLCNLPHNAQFQI